MAGVVFFLVGVNPFGGPPGVQAPPSPVSPLTQPQPQTVPTTPQPRPQAPPTAQPQPQAEPETVVTVLPLPQAPTAPHSVAKPVPAPPRVGVRPPAPAQTARPAPTPQPERPALTADAAGNWRVVVGSFGNRENAERLAATLGQQGYPVSLEAFGAFTRVWVGPYHSQERAQSIADTLGQYRPQVVRMPAGISPAPPQAGAGRFLQVGAFRTAQNAQSVVEAVQQAGYPVVLVEEAGLIKVRVGPFDDTSVAAAALRARGLEVLEVR